MSGIYVSHFASALGGVRQSVEQAEAAGQLFSGARALRAAGFGTHHVCGADESAYSLAVRAVTATGIDPAAIDAIVYSTCLPLSANLGRSADFERSGDVKHLMQFAASELQAELGMQRAFVVGLNQQACTGMLGALRIARGLLRAESDLNRVLCLTADRFPPGARYEQSFNLVSDGAAACLVSRDRQGLELLDVHHITNGAMAFASDEEAAASYFNYSCRLIGEVLERRGLAISDVRRVVPQNINRTAWTILKKLLNVSAEQDWCPSVADTGHVISADNVINLHRLCEEGPLARGDKILTFMAGYGTNWQCALLEAA